MRNRYHMVLGFRAKRTLLGFLLLCSTFVFAQSRADQVKAVFLYNFTQFVDFPPSTVGNSFVLGILGNDPFGDYIDSVVNGEKVNGLPIVVKRFDNVEDIRDCNILYINDANPIAAVRALGKRNILTVGSTENFAREGGIIRFFIESNKIRLQINLAAAKAANLSISSKLLRVSDVIQK